MNYYILPKNNNIFKLCPKLQDITDTIITPYTNYSLFKNYNDIMAQIKDVEREYSSEYVNNILKLVHSHEYIFSFSSKHFISFGYFSNLFYYLLSQLDHLSVI